MDYAGHTRDNRAYSLVLRDVALFSFIKVKGGDCVGW